MFYEIKEIINIDNNCIETYPCEHYVSYKTKTGEIKEKFFSMQDIYQLCKDLKYRTPIHIENEYNFWKNESELSSFNDKLREDNVSKENKENKEENKTCLII